MTRSERFAKEGKVEVYIGSFEEATVIKDCTEVEGLRYICTDFHCIYNGESVWVDVYEDNDGKLYAVIEG